MRDHKDSFMFTLSLFFVLTFFFYLSCELEYYYLSNIIIISKQIVISKKIDQIHKFPALFVHKEINWDHENDKVEWTRCKIRRELLLADLVGLRNTSKILKYLPIVNCRGNTKPAAVNYRGFFR